MTFGTVLALIKAGLSDSSSIAEAVDAWLEAHPEATTTVQDGSITKAKLVAALSSEISQNTADVAGLKSTLDADESLSMRSVSFEWEEGDFDGQGQEIPGANYRRTGYIAASPISFQLNGATALYIYYYDSNKTHLSHVSKNVDGTFFPNKVAGCAYYRLETKATNLPLLKLFAYSDNVFTVLELKKSLLDNQRQITLKISDYFERGTFIYATGKLPPYSTDTFSTRRTGRYLRVVGGTSIQAPTFTGGTFYCFEYDGSKNLITKYNFVSGSKRTLDDNTVWVRFQHDSWSGADESVTYVSPTYFPTWGYEPRLNGDTVSFMYQVYPCNGTDVADTATTLNTSSYKTSGLLMLPPNYSEDGAPVPVIYFAHGSADYYDIAATEFSQNYMDYFHYLRDEGYAIFDCYGWTNKYITSGAQMANPTNMAAIKQGLEWVSRHFNVDISHVYVTGKSLGGLQAINMCYEGDFPIKACCPLSPALDAAEIGFGYSVPARKAYCADLGFSEDTGGVLDEEWSGNLSSASAAYKAYALANADKLLGYNPIYRNLIGIDAAEFVQFEIDGQGGTGTGQDLPNKLKTMSRICNIPTKIIMAVDDNACAPTQCAAYIQSIKNAGGVAEMRWLPANTGKHHAVDTDPAALKVASITTKCGITYTDVPLAYADMVQFFRRYS